ncbi:MAG: PAS domain S-box protein [Bacteroidota bacterium]|nr:PAS domain S-box protein [Bacteroidota bacterium]
MKLIKSNKKKRISFFCIFFFLSFNLFSYPIAKKGVIDLSSWDFENNGITYLHGQWEFYWNQLLEPSDFQKNELPKPTFMNVPGLWNSNDSFPTFGYGTYRLLIKTNSIKELSIKLLSASSSYSIWINGKKVGGNGTVGKSKDSYIPMQNPSFYNIHIDENNNEIIEIIIQVANFHHSKAGLWEAVEIGTFKQIHSKITKNNIWNSIIFGILLVLFIYHFILYFLRRKELSNLYLGLFIFFMALRNFVTNNELILQLLPNLTFTPLLRIQFFTGFPVIIFAGLYFYYMFKEFFNNKLITIIVIINIIVAGIILFTKVSFFSAITPFFGVFLLIGGLYFILALINATRHEERGAALALTGLLVMLLAGIIDIVSTLFTLSWTYVAPYGVVIFSILQTFIITQRFSIALDENIELNKNLYLQNKNLEKTIKSRTQEIQEKVKLLELSEEELIQNNEELKSLYDNIDKQNTIIKEKEIKLENILNSIGEGVIITDFNENFLYANPVAHDIFEVEQGELLNKNLKEFISDDEWTKIIIKTQRKTTNKTNTYEIILQLSSGVKNIIVSAVPHEVAGKSSASLAIFRDISNRVRREKEITNLKNQLEILTNNLPAHVYYKDKNLRYILANNSYANSLDIEIKSIIGKTDYDILSIKRAKELEKLDEIVLSENRAILNFEIKGIDIKMTEKWWSVSKVPFFDGAGKIAGIVGIVYDITEQKKNRELLIQKNRTLQKYFTALEQSPITFLFTDFEGNIQYANPDFYKFSGYTPDETIRQNMNFTNSPETPASTINEMWSTIKSKKTWKGEFISIKKDKTKFIEKVIISPIIDENRYITSFIAIKEDITEFKKAEALIKQKNKQFSNTIYNMLDIYIKCDFDGNILDASPSIVDEFKSSSLEKILQTNIFKWIEIEENRKNLFFSELFQNKNIKSFAFQFIREDGVLQYAEMNAVMYKINNKAKGFEGIIRNVTSRIKFETTLKNQKEEIEFIHKEIQSSIEYAKYIQNSLLPQKHVIDSSFRKNFIIYLPRDVVSGDFYYLRKINDSTIFAVADCTGHGVAGGFLTMLSITILDEIVRSNEELTASDILNLLRIRIKNIYINFGSKSHSGLDIVLCIIDENNKKLQYSGANLPLYLIRDKHLIIFNPVKNPIGIFIKEKPFENKFINLYENDLLYLFSDGIQDQFGEKKQIKFSKLQLQNILIDNSELPIKEQKTKIFETINKWMGDNRQIDDITLMGIKI